MAYLADQKVTWKFIVRRESPLVGRILGEAGKMHQASAKEGDRKE